jgi:hypothetical protein
MGKSICNVIDTKTETTSFSEGTRVNGEITVRFQYQNMNVDAALILALEQVIGEIIKRCELDDGR